MIEIKNLVVILDDRGYCVFIFKRSDCDKKLRSMIDEGITNGIYVTTIDTTLNDLNNCQDFLRCNFNG